MQADILFSFLAYALWKVLEQWVARSGLGNGPRPVIEELARIRTNDMILPMFSGRELRTRWMTRPDESQRILLSRLGCGATRSTGRAKAAKSPADVGKTSDQHRPRRPQKRRPDP